MKTFILATVTVLSLGVGVANAQSYSHEAPPHQSQSINQPGLEGGGG